MHMDSVLNELLSAVPDPAVTEQVAVLRGYWQQRNDKPVVIVDEAGNGATRGLSGDPMHRLEHATLWIDRNEWLYAAPFATSLLGYRRQYHQ
jgi:hypothetical protein